MTKGLNQQLLPAGSGGSDVAVDGGSDVAVDIDSKASQKASQKFTGTLHRIMTGDAAAIKHFVLNNEDSKTAGYRREAAKTIVEPDEYNFSKYAEEGVRIDGTELRGIVVMPVNNTAGECIGFVEITNKKDLKDIHTELQKHFPKARGYETVTRNTTGKLFLLPYAGNVKAMNTAIEQCQADGIGNFAEQPNYNFSVTSQGAVSDEKPVAEAADEVQTQSSCCPSAPTASEDDQDEAQTASCATPAAKKSWYSAGLAFAAGATGAALNFLVKKGVLDTAKGYATGGVLSVASAACSVYSLCTTPGASKTAKAVMTVTAVGAGVGAGAIWGGLAGIATVGAVTTSLAVPVVRGLRELMCG